MTVLRSFRYYNYRLHFTGQFVSLVGTWMQRVAISWLVYQVTGSAFLLGLITFLSLIPSLILSPYVGSFVDRHNAYKLVKITQFALMLQTGAMALLVWFKIYSMPWICFLSLMQGVITAFDTTSRQSMMGYLIPDRNDLPNAIALNSTAFNMARLVGPALAGVVLSTWGQDVCFLLNFVSFFAVLGCLHFMKLNVPEIVPAQQNIWVGLKEGYDYLKKTPGIASLIILLACSSLFVIPFTTMLPVIAKELFHGDATTFSWFESAGGFGALAGAIFMASLKPQQDTIKVAMISALVFAIGLTLLATSPALHAALACTMLATTGMMVQTSAINTFIQTHALPEMRGRAISYYIMAFQGILPLGSLLIGFAANKFGARLTLGVEGVLGLIIIAAYMV